MEVSKLEKANAILIARKQSGYTQKGLAELLGVSQSAVSLWEKGETLPDIHTANKLALIFGVTIEDLIDSTNYQAQQPIAKIRANCLKMNEEGQAKVLQYSEDLLEIEKFKKAPVLPSNE